MALPIDRRNGAPVPQLGPPPGEDVAPTPSVEALPLVPVTVQRVTTAAVLAVAAIASYEHMRALAEVAGEGWRSWLLPISVDGLAVAASMTMLVRRRRGGLLPWTALLLGPRGVTGRQRGGRGSHGGGPVGGGVAAGRPAALLRTSAPTTQRTRPGWSWLPNRPPRCCAAPRWVTHDTTVLSPIEFDHLVQVVRHQACGYRAECWCGWNSVWCDDYATADEAGQDHREIAAGRPMASTPR